MTGVGTKIRKARLNKRLSLRKLGKELNCSAMYLSNIENEKQLPQNSKMFKKLVRSLDLDLRDIQNKIIRYKVSIYEEKLREWR